MIDDVFHSILLLSIPFYSITLYFISPYFVNFFPLFHSVLFLNENSIKIDNRSVTTELYKYVSMKKRMRKYMERN